MKTTLISHHHKKMLRYFFASHLPYTSGVVVAPSIHSYHLQSNTSTSCWLLTTWLHKHLRAFCCCCGLFFFVCSVAVQNESIRYIFALFCHSFVDSLISFQQESSTNPTSHQMRWFSLNWMVECGRKKRKR